MVLAVSTVFAAVVMVGPLHASQAMVTHTAPVAASIARDAATSHTRLQPHERPAAGDKKAVIAGAAAGGVVAGLLVGVTCMGDEDVNCKSLTVFAAVAGATVGVLVGAGVDAAFERSSVPRVEAKWNTGSHSAARRLLGMSKSHRRSGFARALRHGVFHHPR